MLYSGIIFLFKCRKRLIFDIIFWINSHFFDFRTFSKTHFIHNNQSYRKFHSSKSLKGDSTNYSSSKKTHFGYQDVSEKEKHENGKYTTA